MSDPAIGLVEFDSISAGIVAGDAMVKASPVASLYAGTIHPGKYLLLVSGDTESVDIALEAAIEVAGGRNLADRVFLPDVHPDVVDAMTAPARPARLDGEAIGIVETTTVASVLDAGDAGVKAADVGLAAVQLADGLGGKGYLIFAGTVAEVEAATEAAVSRVDEHGTLVRSDIIAQVHEEMADNLTAKLRFLERVGRP